MHADLMIHSDSTTGVEAAIMGTPSINVSPIEKWSQQFIVRDLAVTVANADQAFALGCEILRSPDHLSASGKADDMFPHNGAEATARAIAALLPPPAPLPPLDWAVAELGEIQRKKFTLTLDECQQAIGRTFPLAGAPKPAVTQRDESTFFLVPQR
jgi:hypothetical protein